MYSHIHITLKQNKLLPVLFYTHHIISNINCKLLSTFNNSIIVLLKFRFQFWCDPAWRPL